MKNINFYNSLKHIKYLGAIMMIGGGLLYVIQTYYFDMPRGQYGLAVYTSLIGWVLYLLPALILLQDLYDDALNRYIKKKS